MDSYFVIGLKMIGSAFALSVLIIIGVIAWYLFVGAVLRFIGVLNGGK